MLQSPTMTLRIGINGFGRIGRLVYRIATERGLDVIAVNDVVPADNLAYLLAHDTMQGSFRLNGRPADVAVVSDGFTVDGRRTQTISVRNPAELPWKSLGVDYVLESTGLFTDFERAGGHLKGGQSGSSSRHRPRAPRVRSPPSASESTTMRMTLRGTPSSATRAARPTVSPRSRRCSMTASGSRRA